jgi:ureidoacrylate peracid hydrolase
LIDRPGQLCRSLTLIVSKPESDLLISLAQKAAPRRAALVVIDVQNDFAADEGFFGRIGADVRSIRTTVIPPLVSLIEHARAAGVLVIFVQAIYDDQYLSAPMRERNRRRTVEMPRCITGTWGADFHAVRPAPGEPVVIKHRYSAMMNTGLDALLKQRGIESLLLTGIATDTCVESTGRDAYFMDYYVTLVADCCGAFNATDHQGALARFDRDYGAIVNADDLVAEWRLTTKQDNAVAVHA